MAAPRPTPVRLLALIILATLTSTLPVFLFGALAPYMMAELRFGGALLGVAVGGIQGVRAVAAFPLGRFVDRRGSVRSLQLACALTIMAMLGLIFLSVNFVTMVPWIALAGFSMALHQPAANRLLIGAVRDQRLGLAFGAKQAIPPLSTLLAGLSVPLLVAASGWRLPFLLVGVIALVMLLISRSLRPDSRLGGTAPGAAPAPIGDISVVGLLATGFGLQLFASSNLLAFYVLSEVDAGRAAGTAGYQLAIGSALVIVVRILLGAACDRIGFSPLRSCAALLASGTVGYALLATGHAVLSPVGLMVALLGSWGAPALFWLGLMRAFPGSPGRATGAMAPGIVGGVAGPILFGSIMEQVGYPASWAMSGLAVLAGAVAIEASHRRIRSSGVSSTVRR